MSRHIDVGNDEIIVYCIYHRGNTLKQVLLSDFMFVCFIFFEIMKICLNVM